MVWHSDLHAHCGSRKSWRYHLHFQLLQPSGSPTSVSIGGRLTPSFNQVTSASFPEADDSEQNAATEKRRGRFGLLLGTNLLICLQGVVLATLLAHAGASRPRSMYLRIVFRSTPVCLAIADADSPCRCISKALSRCLKCGRVRPTPRFSGRQWALSRCLKCGRVRPTPRFSGRQCTHGFPRGHCLASMGSNLCCRAVGLGGDEEISDGGEDRHEMLQ
ncbi:hypothetical protein SAMN02927914_06733 [Mesorhizobium qingshengii]|uniref:Uncharacterized protein n=1 Tax=Mesorhizobium qingshengii TaxID=1165689 RepID=A0A1G5ZZ71_9HYPH|nr:hypothetical protein SAMN02927914_06733 [Mesorhizobium qingshengii]